MSRGPYMTEPGEEESQGRQRAPLLEGASRVLQWVGSLSFHRERATEAAKALRNDAERVLHIRLLAWASRPATRQGQQQQQQQKQQVATPREAIAPVVLRLRDAVFSEDALTERKLTRTLAETYRVLVELLVASFALGDEDVPDESMSRVLEVAEYLTLVLRRMEVADARFEMRCVLEAGKALRMAREVLMPLFGCVAAVVAAAQGNGDLRDGCERLKRVMKNKQLLAGVEEWYLWVYNMRWLGACVASVRDWELYFKPEVVKSQHKGAKYAVGLAMLFMKIVRDARKEPELKERAFIGNGDQLGLRHLLDLEPEGLSRLFYRSKRAFCTGQDEMVDPYRKVRRLTAEYLWKIARSRNHKYDPFRQRSMRALRARFSKLQHRLSQYQREQVQNALHRLENREEEPEEGVAAKNVLSLAL